MPTHKSEDFKISAVNYYLDSNKTQLDSFSLTHLLQIIYFSFINKSLIRTLGDSCLHDLDAGLSDFVKTKSHTTSMLLY